MASPAPSLRYDAPLRIAAARRTRRALWVALLLSLAIHAVWSLWPVEPLSTPEETVLSATLTELPPPPVPLLVASPPVPVADGVPEPLVEAPEPSSPEDSESEHAARRVKPRAREERARAFMVPGYSASERFAR